MSASEPSHDQSEGDQTSITRDSPLPDSSKQDDPSSHSGKPGSREHSAERNPSRQRYDVLEDQLQKLEAETCSLKGEIDGSNWDRLDQLRAEKVKIRKQLKYMLEKDEANKQRDKQIADCKEKLTQLERKLMKAKDSDELDVVRKLSILRIPNLEKEIRELEIEKVLAVDDSDEAEVKKTIGTKEPRDVKTESSEERLSRLRSGVILDAKDVGEELGHFEILTNQYRALDWIMSKLAAPSQSPTEKNSESGIRAPAVPEIKTVTWGEWVAHLGHRTPHEHSAIDLVYEEPLGAGLNGRTVQGIRESAKSQATSTVPVNRPEIQALPDSIRINSVAAKRILDNLCDNNLRFGNYEPLVISRPFKILVYLEQEIRDKLIDIDRLYSNRLDAGEVVDLDEKRLVNDSRFPSELPFFGDFEWNKLTITEVKEALDDFGCLKLLIDDWIAPLRDYLKDRPTNVLFPELWHLYTPGSLVYVKDKSISQKIWKIINATGGRRYRCNPEIESMRSWRDKSSPLVIHCYHLDYNGFKYVQTLRKFRIDSFSDCQLIGSLPVLPFPVAEAEGLVDRNALLAQGQQFINYTKPCHRYYEGRSLSQDSQGNPLYKPNLDGTETSRVYSERIESQVMVDFERALQAIPDWTPGIFEPTPSTSHPAELDSFVYEDDSHWDMKYWEEFVETERLKQQNWEKFGTAPEGNDVLLFPDRVFGFAFRSRTWVCLQLGQDSNGQQRLRQIEHRQDAWRDLEIESQHKSVVQSLIDSHFEKKDAKDGGFDLIRNKGKGVIILLHGVPGVGKTSTAECVAESNNRPLLSITCGDLGMTAREVEQRLETDFQLAQAWNCILLLDEADIFLAERTNHDVERNALVSVFLRVLEYYEGVLFLTTNRVGAFDEAFRSRIHMALYYPPLNWLQTEKIWKSHIRRARDRFVNFECNETELIKFAFELFANQNNNIEGTGPVWNGRQIRNAFQSAVALARHQSKTRAQGLEVVTNVTTEHFTTVAQVSNVFSNYLWKVKGGRTAGDINREREIRDDDVGVHSFKAAAGSYQPSQPGLGSPMPMRQTNSHNQQGAVYTTPQHQQSHSYGTGNMIPAPFMAFNTQAAPQSQYAHESPSTTNTYVGQSYSHQIPPPTMSYGVPTNQLDRSQQVPQPSMFSGGPGGQLPPQQQQQQQQQQHDPQMQQQQQSGIAYSGIPIQPLQQQPMMGGQIPQYPSAQQQQQ